MDDHSSLNSGGNPAQHNPNNEQSGNKANRSRAKKITTRLLVALSFVMLEGILMWTMADSRISYSPVRSEVIAGVKPPKPLIKTEKNIESYPVLALSDMYLVVPKLYINAPVDPVGVTPTGEMASPSSLQRVAWYKDGTKPGASGSSVLAGHYGNAQEMGIFRSLDKLEEGDVLEVRTKTAQSLKYKVYKKSIYKVADVPLQELFNKYDSKYLNLVTCVGDWDPSTNSLDKRLIIYAKMD